MAESEATDTASRVILAPDFENRLKGLIGSGDALQAGRVSIIGLDRVKERFGGTWKRISIRADRIVRNTIERYLLPSDIFTVFGETNYVLVLSSLDTEQARLKCLLIAEEVMKALLGEEGADLISVGTAVAQLDASFSLDDMLSAGRPLSAATLPAAAVGGEERSKLSHLEPGIEPAPAHAANPDGPIFMFQPMWDTAKAVLSTYMCTPVDGSRQAERDIGEDLEAAVRLDLALQKRVLDELSRMSSEGSKVLIGLSVHFGTLAAATHRRHYIQTFEQRLARAAAQLLVIEIADVPAGVPQSRMHELTIPLARFCRAMVARVRLEANEFSALGGSKVAAVGCSVGDHAASELSIIQLMSRFNRAAEKAHLATYVRGLSSVSLAAAAVGAGFRYVDGPSIGEFVQHPSRVVRFNLHDVYRSLLRA